MPETLPFIAVSAKIAEHKTGRATGRSVTGCRGNSRNIDRRASLGDWPIPIIIFGNYQIIIRYSICAIRRKFATSTDNNSSYLSDSDGLSRVAISKMTPTDLTCAPIPPMASTSLKISADMVNLCLYQIYTSIPIDRSDLDFCVMAGKPSIGVLRSADAMSHGRISTSTSIYGDRGGDISRDFHRYKIDPLQTTSGNRIRIRKIRPVIF